MTGLEHVSLLACFHHQLPLGIPLGNSGHPVEKQDTGSIHHSPLWTNVPFQGLHGHDHSRRRLSGRTRPSMRTFFEPRRTSRGHSNHVAMTHRTISHHTLGLNKNTTPKAKRKAEPGISCSTYHVVIKHLLYRLLLPLLFFIQARRTGFAALK